MKQKQIVRLTLEAIDSVKSRAKAAKEAGDLGAYRELMGDLLTLEVSLVGDVTKLLDELEAA